MPYEILLSGKWVPFSTSDEVGKKLSELLGFRQSLMVRFNLSRPLMTNLLGEKVGQQRVELISGQEKNIVTRDTSLIPGDVTVSTSASEEHPYLCLDVMKNYDDETVDRGLCWVHPNNADPAVVTVNFHRKSEDLLNSKRITEIIDKAQEFAESEVERLLNLKAA